MTPLKAISSHYDIPQAALRANREDLKNATHVLMWYDYHVRGHTLKQISDTYNTSTTNTHRIINTIHNTEDTDIKELCNKLKKCNI